MTPIEQMAREYTNAMGYAIMDKAELEAMREAIIKDYQQSAEYEAIKADAERYRWLREQTWTSDSMCVVAYPSKAIKIGSYCPSTDRLDQAIDQARKI